MSKGISMESINGSSTSATIHWNGSSQISAKVGA